MHIISHEAMPGDQSLVDFAETLKSLSRKVHTNFSEELKLVCPTHFIGGRLADILLIVQLLAGNTEMKSSGNW